MCNSTCVCYGFSNLRFQFACPSSWNWTGLTVVSFGDVVEGGLIPSARRSVLICWLNKISKITLRRPHFIIQLYMDRPEIKLGLSRKDTGRDTACSVGDFI